MAFGATIVIFHSAEGRQRINGNQFALHLWLASTLTRQISRVVKEDIDEKDSGVAGLANAGFWGMDAAKPWAQCKHSIARQVLTLNQRTEAMQQGLRIGFRL